MGIEHRPNEITAAALEQVRALYESGRYLTAYHKAIELAPLAQWRGTEARLLAGRIAGNVGSMRLGDWHWVHAYRDAPNDPEATWYFANYLSNVRGPLRAWQFIKTREMPADATAEHRAHWFSLKGRVLGTLRDFDAAEEWLTRAEALGQFTWVDMERAAVLLGEDRHDDAEAAVRGSLERRPWYRPAVQWLVHFLVQRERDGDALELCREGTSRLESSGLWMQYYHLLRELDRLEEASQALDEFERTSPLLDAIGQEALAARRCDIAYQRGDWAESKAQNAKVAQLAQSGPIHRRHDVPFCDAFDAAIDKVIADPAGHASRGVLLSVPFVRQNFQTCVPATLAAICRYWGVEVDHLAAAEEITYRGTPHVKERRWAEKSGFVTKEFTVTWDAAVLLLDRGIPFTLTTAEVTSAHLQAVIGYDRVRKAFWIRDPGERHRREIFIDTFIRTLRGDRPARHGDGPRRPGRPLALADLARRGAAQSPAQDRARDR